MLHRPALGVVPVTQIMGAEFVWMYSSVITQVFGVVPQVVVDTVLNIRGGKLDCGLCEYAICFRYRVLFAFAYGFYGTN